MIDAYTIGITLALDNGVSEGLETIRRDLITLNGVVEGSATRLKHLARAAADLRIGLDAVDPVDKGSTLPTRGLVPELIPRPPSDLPQLDAGLSAMSGPDLVLAAKALAPALSFPATQSIADIGTVPVDPPGVASPKIRSLVPIMPAPAPTTEQERAQDSAIADLSRVGYTRQRPSAIAGHTTTQGGRADRQLMAPGTAVPLSTAIDGGPSLSMANARDPSVPPTVNRPSLRSLQQATDVEPQSDAPRKTQEAPSDPMAWAYSPSLDPLLPSAVPPPSEPRPSESRGAIYVDGSRLGRWMTDRLVKASALPRATTTGFDPRMTPTWPGAPVGS